MTPALIAAAINHLLAQDAAQQRHLAAHAGKIARIDTGVMDLRLAVEAGGMVKPADRSTEPSVSIFIAAADLPLLMQDRERAFSRVRIEGDADFANAISQLMNRLRWDPEEDFSRVFGDLAGTRIAATARRGAASLRAAHNSMMENVAEYLLEENPVLVRQEQLRDFGTQVSVLRDDVERLAKRLDKLKSKGRA